MRGQMNPITSRRKERESSSLHSSSTMFREDTGEINRIYRSYWTEKSLKESRDRMNRLLELMDRLSTLRKFEDKIPCDLYLELLEGLRDEFKET